MAAFGILVFAWDLGARRALGARPAFCKSAVVDGLPAFLSIVLVARRHLHRDLDRLAAARQRLRPRLRLEEPGARRDEGGARRLPVADPLPPGSAGLPHRRLHQERHPPVLVAPGRLADHRPPDRLRRGQRHQARAPTAATPRTGDELPVGHLGRRYAAAVVGRRAGAARRRWCSGSPSGTGGSAYRSSAT